MKAMSAGDRGKPDFIIIGSAKSGTTTLYDDLARLDGLYLPSDKEPSILTKYDDIDQVRAEYRMHFGGALPGQLCGEGSTNYTKIPEYVGVAEKAYRLCGRELKLVMIMRDPIQRIYSHLRHNVAVRRVSADDIDRVVLSDPIYVSVSDYGKQIKPWIDYFGVENLHCVSFADYRENRVETIRDLAVFLGVPADSSGQINGSVSNKSSELRYTSSGMARLLDSPFYRRFIRKVLPNGVREWYRNLLLPKAAAPEITLSVAVEKELRARLANVEVEVEALVGKRIRIDES